MTVYLDANGNGTSTLARDDGFCALIALPAGACKVRIITPTDATQTSPAQYATTINGSGPLGSGQDFGLKLPGITLTNIPAAGSAEAASAAGAVVTFLNSTIIDPADPHPTLTFDPPSGSLFPIGTTTVHFTATDHAGNSSVSTFAVTVIALPARVRNISVQKQSSLKHKTISVIIVSFNDALSAGLAQGLGSYSLATIAQGKKSKSVSLASAIDDASSHTVTRTTKKPLVLSPALKLQILGSGLLDALGRPHDGQRGGDCSATLSKQGIGIAKSRGASRHAQPSAASVDALLAQDWMPTRRASNEPKRGGREWCLMTLKAALGVPRRPA